MKTISIFEYTLLNKVEPGVYTVYVTDENGIPIDIIDMESLWKSVKEMVQKAGLTFEEIDIKYDNDNLIHDKKLQNEIHQYLINNSK
ncbi:hypothetical protein [Neobacillus bataviensis]|uniref:hypothetical protein n=1 Tax=Neobacillus bataviensis TaxID=220685 RepID=UPI001CBEFA0F|nr:hypothetical protein [Neobacillus bataviensis]